MNTQLTLIEQSEYDWALDPGTCAIGRAGLALARATLAGLDDAPLADAA